MTVREMVTEWLAPPPLALIVTVLVPRVAAGVAVKESMTVQVGLQGLFVKDAVTPEGRPDAEKVTGDVEPLLSIAVIDDDELDAP